MKKFIITLALVLVSIASFAQNVQWFQATSFAYKPAYGSWTDWEPSTVKIAFNFSDNTIVIYSPQTQIYAVIRQVPADYDPNGIQEKYYVVNANGSYGYIRLRIEKNGNSQIYIDYSDVSLVYNVRRI